jgi:hypothetical protein
MRTSPAVNGVSVAMDETTREVGERQRARRGPAREIRAVAADNGPGPTIGRVCAAADGVSTRWGCDGVAARMGSPHAVNGGTAVGVVGFGASSPSTPTTGRPPARRRARGSAFARFARALAQSGRWGAMRLYGRVALACRLSGWPTLGGRATIARAIVPFVGVFALRESDPKHAAAAAAASNTSTPSMPRGPAAAALAPSDSEARIRAR